MSSIVKLTNNGIPIQLGNDHIQSSPIDQGALDYAIKNLGIKSMIDLGFGPEGMVEFARSKGIDAIGLNSNFVVTSQSDDVIMHDYQIGSYIPDRNFDLAWAIEFAEHIEEQHIRNFVSTMDKCRYVIMTHAIPNQQSHHRISRQHTLYQVNCQSFQYWYNIMNAFGFSLDFEHTNKIRTVSTMREQYIRERGMFFRNRNFKTANKLWLETV